MIRLLDKSLNSYPKQDVNHHCPDIAVDPTGFVVEENRKLKAIYCQGNFSVNLSWNVYNYFSRWRVDGNA